MKRFGTLKFQGAQCRNKKKPRNSGVQGGVPQGREKVLVTSRTRDPMEGGPRNGGPRRKKDGWVVLLGLNGVKTARKLQETKGGAGWSSRKRGRGADPPSERTQEKRSEGLIPKGKTERKAHSK